MSTAEGGHMDDIRQRVRAFLDQFLRGHRIDDDENYFATGHFNSLFVMQLVLFVENELGVPVEDEDLEMENFNSVSAIARMVERKSRAADRG
uniref:Acyl-carrier protein n=1 Tax=Streptoalloteichus sp. ATCC 53650 TaxID=756733 RepID=K4P126_9PSEU|nr:acyl-carrier protein [Streptoalloteichus sp. ATCC 53650]